MGLPLHLSKTNPLVNNTAWDGHLVVLHNNRGAPWSSARLQCKTSQADHRLENSRCPPDSDWVPGYSRECKRQRTEKILCPTFQLLCLRHDGALTLYCPDGRKT